jgi:class 3 adenylate cyclase
VKDARFRTDPLTMSFADPAVERAWWREFSTENRRPIRRAVFALVLVFSAFVLNDIVLFRERFVPLTLLRFGLVVPSLAAAWVWSGTARGARWLDDHLQEFLLFLAIVANGAMLAMTTILAKGATPEQIWFSTPGFLLALLCTYSLSRLRFAYAGAVSIAMTVAALVILAIWSPNDPSWLLVAPFALATNLAGAWISRTLEGQGRREFAERQLLAEARARSEALLRNVLPAGLAEQLREAPRAAVAQRYDDVSVVLADVVGFTPLCERLPLEELARLLGDLHDRFDRLCELHGIEKIKTLGDAWLAAAGVPVPEVRHLDAAARFALAVRDLGREQGLSLRVGLHVGSAAAGVIGRTRFAYDLWGDAVAGAAAMERASRPGGVRLSPDAAARLKGRFRIVEEDGAAWLEGVQP